METTLKPCWRMLLLPLLLLLAACGGGGEATPAQLRIGQFLYAPETARITLSSPDADSAAYTLDYASLTDYQSFAPGIYTLDVTAGGRHLLHETVGLGTGGRYSLLVAGIPSASQEVNQSTFGTRLHRIFEGAAARTDNAFLPQILLQNDYFVPVPGKGNLRVTQLAPGIVPVDLELNRKGEQTATLSGVAYTHASDRERFAAGNYAAALHLAGSPQHRLDFQLSVDTASFTNLYVVPEMTASGRLRVVTGKTFSSGGNASGR